MKRRRVLKTRKVENYYWTRLFVDGKLRGAVSGETERESIDRMKEFADRHFPEERK